MIERCSAEGCRAWTKLMGVCVSLNRENQKGLLELPTSVVLLLCPKHFVMRPDKTLADREAGRSCWRSR